MGDLPGITARLPHLAELGVDAVWLSPFYTSPQHDAGYDVADYRDVDPRFGTLADSDAMVERAHELGSARARRHRAQPLLQRPPVVPGGPRCRAGQSPSAPATSSARAAARTATRPPTTGSATSVAPPGAGDRGGRVSPGQWYLHLFDVTQPDFDWTNPEVGDEMESVLRFWLDRGADGFRIDVAHGLVKVDGSSGRPGGPRIAMPSAPPTSRCGTSRACTTSTAAGARSPTPTPCEGEDADRILCAEAWVQPSDVAGALRPRGRAAPVVQLLLPDEPVDRARDAAR